MLFNREMIKGSTSMLIMSLLYKEGPLYGYQIAKLIDERSDHELSFKEGTLYPALYKLEEEGMLVTEWKVVEGRKRRYYALTPAGREDFLKRQNEWFSLINSVKKVLGHV
ncbi:PadR family transcriptional regulator [Paenibacillus aurantiacus]|uniref:PadR family transcriptional regulator n=1 Tax=Paenibacillus aurantiacus TaxID=1936118 RepID=A0ABV5KMV1_9BACL